MRRCFIVLLISCSALLSACASLTSDLSAPELKVSKVGLVKAGLLQQEWQIDLTAHNPNDRKITVKSLSYDLFIDDHRFARGSTNEKVVLKAHEDGEFSTHIKTGLIETVNKFKQIGITPGKPVPYRIKGRVNVGLVPFAIPFDKDGEIPLPAW